MNTHVVVALLILPLFWAERSKAETDYYLCANPETRPYAESVAASPCSTLDPSLGALKAAVERPESPTAVTPAPRLVCAGGAIATCNPVSDWYCYPARACEVTGISLSEVLHPDGNHWANHWLACKDTVTELQEKLKTQGVELNLWRTGVYRLKKGKTGR